MATTKKRSIWNLADYVEGDKVVWIIVMMLILTSIICIFSSTSRLLSAGQTRLDIVRGQLLLVCAGLGLIIICYNIKNIKFFRWCSKWGFPLSAALLLMLDLHISTPFIRALNINHAYRILSIAGVQVHVFEVVKVAMVLYLAWAQDAFNKGELKWIKSKRWQKRVYIYLPFLLTTAMILPGSNSSALFIGGIMFIVILLGGGNFKEMAALLLAGIALIVLCLGVYKISGGKALGRIGTAVERITDDTDWETQFKNSKKNSASYQAALDELRQPYSAKIAIHQGKLFGKGPGQSTQRYIVPDISEDYMYSFIIEEYGLLGGLLVIFLYVSLLARGAIIVRNCGKDQYAKLAVAGLCLLITGQAFLHMFVNVDIGPMTGQTLPLISHGNSAFLCFSLAFGVILSISRIATRRIERETLDADPLVAVQATEATKKDDYDE